MKKLLLFMGVVLMMACDLSDREQKLADEVLELKTAQIQQEADQKIAMLRDDFAAQLEGLNEQNQKEKADVTSIFNNLREENQALMLQLAAATRGHGGDVEGSGSANGHGHETPARFDPAEGDSRGAIPIRRRIHRCQSCRLRRRALSARGYLSHSCK